MRRCKGGWGGEEGFIRSAPRARMEREAGRGAGAFVPARSSPRVQVWCNSAATEPGQGAGSAAPSAGRLCWAERGIFPAEVSVCCLSSAL